MWRVTEVVVALDVGGTKLLGGLVTADGAVVARRQVPTPRDPTGCDPGAFGRNSATVNCRSSALSTISCTLAAPPKAAGSIVRRATTVGDTASGMGPYTCSANIASSCERRCRHASGAGPPRTSGGGEWGWIVAMCG